MTRRLTLVLVLSAVARAAQPSLDGMDRLETPRRELIEKSLQALEDHPGIRYLYSGSSPEDGGMDCSGAVFYLLGKVGIDPPRSAQAQYDWVKESGKLTVVPPEAVKPEDAAFTALKPGDLLFWGSTDSGTLHVTHVQIYLGKEAKDGRRVMIGSSDGRSYRGTKKDGFDIVDFKIPQPEAPKKLVGYGPPVWKK